MTTPEPTGIDLARVALQAAKEAAKERGASSAKCRTRRTSTAPRRGAGRDPIGLGAAIGDLIAARGWETPVATGSLVDQWPALAPELAAHVTVLTVDEATATLELLADSPAYATQARLMQAVLLQRITQATGREAVRTIKVHQPGSTSRRSAGRAAAEPPTPSRAPEPSEDQVGTRAQASPGYQRVLAAFRESTSGSAAAPFEQQVHERAAQQDDALRLHREPEEDFTDGQAALEATRGRPAGSDDARRRALAYKQAVKDGRAHGTRSERLSRSA